MGSTQSKPDVDLLPPRFQKEAHPLTRLQTSPFDHSFGARKRHELFNLYHASEQGIAFRLGMKPDIDEQVDVSIESATDASYKALSSAQAHLGYRDDESNPVWQGTISANTSTGLKSTFSIFDVVNGYGAYTILPLEKLAQLANSEIQTGHSSQEISESCSSLPNIEVGGRCVNPARGLAAGIQLSPFVNVPTRFWMIGNYRRILTVGCQLHADLGRVHDAVRPTQQSYQPPKSLAPWWSPSMRALDVGVSFSQDQLYEITFAVDGLKEELVAGYIHQMTLRRPVFNLFEEYNVKGIYNYVDVGFELRRRVRAPFESKVVMGASWQLNKNALVKGKVGTDKSALSVGFKSWWDPEATLVLTANYDREEQEPRLGISFSLEKGGSPEYRKAIRGYQQSAANHALDARESINQRITPFTDPEPFQDIRR